jgi:hypothetical protein
MGFNENNLKVIPLAYLDLFFATDKKAQNFQFMLGMLIPFHANRHCSSLPPLFNRSSF